VILAVLTSQKPGQQELPERTGSPTTHIRPEPAGEPARPGVPHPQADRKTNASSPTS